MRPQIPFWLLCSWLLGGPLAAATADFSAIDEASYRQPPGAELAEPRWIGPDGEALPFRDEAELLEFLRTAPIVSEERLAQGITRSLKVLLEQDGVRAHAIFRRVSANRPGYRQPGSRINAGFRDSCFFEPAAYELGRLLGIRRIPPVVERQHGGKHGTLQIWVENAFDEQERQERGLHPPQPARWLREQNVRQIFDALILNIDRNQGNLLIDPEWNVWLIDHTRAFVAQPDLPDRRKITRCDRDLWQRLKTVDREAASAELEPYLNSRELKSLMIRWDKLVEHIEGLIAERGEGAVLF